MSSSDSEAAEWEREQMLRGTQSQARHQRQSSYRNQKPATSGHTQSDQKTDVINASLAKQHVQLDIEKVEQDMEVTKRNIGSTRLDIIRAKKRLEAMYKQIEKLEAANRLFDQLEKLSEPSQVLELFEKNRQMINDLPEDQREMMISLKERLNQPVK